AVLDAGMAARADRLDVLAELAALHPGGRRATLADTHAVVLLELLAQERHGVDGLDDVRLQLVERGPCDVADVVARAATRLEPALRHEPVVHLRHGVLRHAMLGRARPHRAPALARVQPALLDPLLDARDQPLDARSGCRLKCHLRSTGTVDEIVPSIVPCSDPDCPTTMQAMDGP